MQFYKHIILALFPLNVCQAQHEKIDRLKKLSFLPVDTAHVNWLNELADAYSFVNTDSLRSLGLQALRKAEQINYKKGVGIASNNLAWANWLQSNNYPEMEFYCRNAISNLAGTINKKELARSWLLLGSCVGSQGNSLLSIEAFNNAAVISAMLNDQMGVATAYSYMADVERNRGQYAKSLDYSRKWLAIAKKYNRLDYLDIWASLYKEAGDYATSLDYYRQSAQYAQSNGRLDELTYFTYSIGEVFFLQGEYDSAHYYYAKALTIAPPGRKLEAQFGELHLALKNYDTALNLLNRAWRQAKRSHNLYEQMWLLLRLAKAYIATTDTKLALEKSNELFHLSRRCSARQHIRDSHFLLYQVYTKTGRKDSAFWHLQHYTLLKDTFDKDISIQQLAFHKLAAEKEKDQSRINLLSKEKELQQHRLSRSSQQKKILLSGIAALCMIAVVVIRSLILKKKNEKLRLEQILAMQELENEKAQAELHQQEMQALRAQMNPHFIFNSLNSINRFILQNNKAQASGYLTKFSKLVRMILQNSQESFISLETELEALQLYMDLEALRFEHHFNYSISVQENIDRDVLKVPPLVMQPYIENAIWHGLMHKEEKGNLDIEITQQDNHLYFKITDDGVGRQKANELAGQSATRHKSMGLKITTQRIVMLNSPGEQSPVIINDLTHPDGSAAGTEVIIKLPVLDT